MKLGLVRGSALVAALAMTLPSCTVTTGGDNDNAEDDIIEDTDSDAGAEDDDETSEAPSETESDAGADDDVVTSEGDAGGGETETDTEDAADASAPDAGKTWNDASADAGPEGYGEPDAADASSTSDIERDLNLPPDPGAEGDESVDGIDSNENVIRDDVERNIGFRYYPNRKLIDLIWRLAKLDQTMVLGVDDPNVVNGAFDEKKLVLGCILGELDGDIAELLRIMGDVSAFVFNTGARFSASRQIEVQLGGQVITLPTDIQVEAYCGGGTETTVSLQAENTQLCSVVGGTTVTLSNDAFNRHDKSLVHLMAIRDLAVAAGGDDAEKYSYRLLYSDSERFWVSGTEEAALLGDATTLGDFAKWRERTDLDALNRWLSGAGSVPEFVQAPIADLNALKSADDAVEAADLEGHVAGLTSDATVGNRIIALGHGLGNNSLNKAYAQVVGSLPDFAGSMRLIGLGTPTATLEGSAEPAYLNQQGDWAVWTAYKALNPSPLAANAENASDTTDPSHHELFFSYLAGDASKDKVEQHLADAFDDVPFPEKTGTNGIITVTLTWGEEPDVDLHTFEPDETHVFYDSQQGTVGELDVDDTDQFGPEHYTVSCEKLVVGTYKLGVNYFAGSNPETATVNIVAGTQSRTVKIDLDEARSSSGDESPLPVADIVVSAGEHDGEFVFGIRSVVEDDQ